MRRPTEYVTKQFKFGWVHKSDGFAGIPGINATALRGIIGNIDESPTRFSLLSGCKVTY